MAKELKDPEEYQFEAKSFKASVNWIRLVFWIVIKLPKEETHTFTNTHTPGNQEIHFNLFYLFFSQKKHINQKNT